MSTTNTFIDSLVSRLKKSQVDLEEFQLQLALGKAEAKDKYEDAKKKLNRIIHEARTKAKDIKAKKNEIQAELEKLQLQLALGKAETKELFEEQKKRIIRALNSLDKKLKDNKYTAEAYVKLHHEIEKFKIKLEILNLHYQEGKLDTKFEFEQRKAEFLKKVNALKEKITEKGKTKQSEQFYTDMKIAYRHLKKAFLGA